MAAICVAPNPPSNSGPPTGLALAAAALAPTDLFQEVRRRNLSRIRVPMRTPFGVGGPHEYYQHSSYVTAPLYSASIQRKLFLRATAARTASAAAAERPASLQARNRSRSTPAAANT